jgi:hypothetical protein
MGLVGVLPAMLEIWNKTKMNGTYLPIILHIISMNNNLKSTKTV